MDIAKGDRIHVNVSGTHLDGIVVKVNTRSVLFHCEGFGHGDECEHRADRTEVTVTMAVRRTRYNRSVDTTPVAVRVRRQMAANARPPRQVPFNVDRWRDHPDLVFAEIDGVVLVDKT